MANLDTREPELSDVIRTIVDQMFLSLNVCLPGKVVSYNPQKQYADVQIQLLKKYSDFSTEPHPVIPNVPVRHPRAAGGNAFIHMPVAIGDDVLLVFSQRSLDNWKTQNVPVVGQNGGVDTNDTRKHHITDAFAILGGSAMPDAFKVTNPSAIEISNGTGKISLFPDGKFKFGNSSADLIDQLQQGFAELGVDTVNTFFGPMKLNAFQTYLNIAAKILSLKE